MRLLIASLVLAQLAGCASYRTSKISAITGGVALVGGIIVGTVAADDVESGSEHGSWNTSTPNLIAASLVMLGVVFGIGGIVGMVAHGKPTPVKPVWKPDE